MKVFFIIILYNYNFQSFDAVIEKIKEQKNILLTFGSVLFVCFGVQSWLNKKKTDVEKIKNENESHQTTLLELIGHNDDSNDETDDENAHEKLYRLKSDIKRTMRKIESFFFN